MRVQIAQSADVASWLALAAEVEPLFGPMVQDPGFHAALKKNIARQTAFCIREGDGLAGSRVLAGMLFSAKPPIYGIGWLAVSRTHRRKRLAAALLRHVTNMVQPPAELTVRTFGSDVPDGEPARQFYLRAGFIPQEMTEPTVHGHSTQLFRKTIQTENNKRDPSLA